MQLTTGQKIGHVLRRFGFGVTPEEFAEAERIGLNKTIDNLIDYERVADDFAVSPWEFTVSGDDFNTDPNRLSSWWALRMVATKRPSQEKLAFFWHDHFAVSAAKVENFPAMLDHLDGLRDNANGSFRKLLDVTTKDAAMLRWLDTDLSIVGKPNENFAREVLELFTLGVGNYSEKDVQELARAFTGWHIRTIFPGGTPAQRKNYVASCLEMGRPLLSASYSPGFHDGAPKSVLGKTAKFDTDSALDLLATHPQTAKYVSTKLWEFYAYVDPEPKVVENLQKKFLDSKGDVKTILLTIATSKEFWSERAIRAQVKSPIDFVVPLFRQMNVKAPILAQRPPTDDPMAAVPPVIRSLGDTTYALMRRMGLRLLYPPDVSGWDWGEAWISPAMMIERFKMGDLLFSRSRTQNNKLIIGRIGTDSTDSHMLADRMLRLLDVDFSIEKRSVLVEAIDRAGGTEAFSTPQTAGPMIAAMFKLVCGSPEFQFN